MHGIGFRRGGFERGHERFVRHGWSHCEIASGSHCKKSEAFVQRRQGKYAVVAWNAINALTRLIRKK